ncbi:hypothetical protein J6590_036965 [Homalodisca vitripennis]|nr:hypothetical protein J6590_036965 [Homalodisca vitripennis]
MFMCKAVNPFQLCTFVITAESQGHYLMSLGIGSEFLVDVVVPKVVRVETVEICELTAPAPLMGAGLGHWVRDVVHSHDLRVLVRAPVPPLAAPLHAPDPDLLPQVCFHFHQPRPNRALLFSL